MRERELEVEGIRPAGRPKTTWSKVVEKDMRKLNVTEDMAENRKQWMQLVSQPTPGVGNYGGYQTKMMMMMNGFFYNCFTL